ncbi:MAG: transcriptional regulator [Propionibacteriaceae bacterium]|nr:transcriptional regulator [Propionibacteriaceae bacterium]
MTVQPIRDLLIVPGSPRLVVACDSVGGIGPRPADVVAVPGDVVAHFAARVPLLEVLCSGARPVALINTLCHDLAEAGTFIDTFRQIAAEVGIAPGAVTGSTEENVPSPATGVGVTVIGAEERPLITGGGRDGDIVVCAGWPRSAPRDAVYVGHPDIVPLEVVKALVDSGLVHDALPVGSRGIGFEAAQLARSAGLTCRPLDHPIPVGDSGGPATCVLLACRPGDEPVLRRLAPAHFPWHPVASLVAP